MFHRISDQGWYLYSFWNPRVALEHTIDEIINQHSKNLFKQVASWAGLYQYLEQFGEHGASIMAKRIPEEYADAFWHEFGLSQNYPMNTSPYWRQYSKREQFSAYFSVIQLEKTLPPDAVRNYLERGVVKATEYGVAFDPVTLFRPTVHTKYYDDTRSGHEYWGKIVAAHWNSKIDEAWSDFHKPVATGPRAPVPFCYRWLSDRAINDNLELVMRYRNYHAFSKLLEAMRFDQLNTKESDIPVEMRVCQHRVKTQPSSHTKITLWDFLVDNFQQTKDEKLLLILAEQIASKRDEVKRLIENEQQKQRYNAYVTNIKKNL